MVMKEFFYDGMTHFQDNGSGLIDHSHKDSKIICIRNESFLYAPSGNPSELLWHEYGHVMSEPVVMADLDHGEKFAEAVRKLGHPWLARWNVYPEWMIDPPTLEAWNEV